MGWLLMKEDNDKVANGGTDIKADLNVAKVEYNEGKH